MTDAVRSAARQAVMFADSEPVSPSFPVMVAVFGNSWQVPASSTVQVIS